MNSYEAKQEARRERLERAADRAERRANSAYERADLREEKSGIPLGQPILVGHHSEKRHRRAIERADNAMRKSIEESNRAKELRGKAASVGSGGISSDDPEAIDKLQEKIEKAETLQDFMKRSNRIVRAAAKKGVTGPKSDGWADYFAKLQAIPGGEKYTEASAQAALEPDFCGRIGFADYQLTNNNANIRRIKQRVAQLEKASEAKTKRHLFDGVCEVVESVEENRVQFFFDGKPPAETRQIMKRHGFRWAPSQGAWQRHLNNSGRYSARLALKALGVEIGQ